VISDKLKINIHSQLRGLYDNTTDNFRYSLVLIAVLSFGISSARMLLSAERPPISIDAAFFQHAGWYITQGAVPYVDIWDINTPLAFEATAFLAFLSGGNMYLLHLLSMAVSVSTGVAIVYLTGTLTYEVTNDKLASLTAGLTLLTLAGFHYLASTGFRPKYPSIAFGLAALLLQFRDRPGYSGCAAAISAGFVQHSAVFAILALGLAIQRGGRKRLTNTILGMLLTTIVVVAPLVIVGAGEAMLVQTVLVPLSGSGSTGLLSIVRRLGKGMILTGFASIPIVLGVYGLFRIGTRDIRKNWWILSGGTIYGIQVFLVDFNSYPDLFFGLVFVAMGLGLLVNTLDEPKRRIIPGVLAIIVLISVVSLGGFGYVTNETVYTKSLDDSLAESDTILHNVVLSAEEYFNARDARGGQMNPDLPFDRPDLEALYWEKQKPPSCHYRLSAKEIQWIERTGGAYEKENCGQYSW